MVISALKQWLASRARVRKTTTIVLHATAGSSVSGAVETLTGKGFSYHYLVDKSGAITKCVPTSRVAFHAGVSVGPEGPDVNPYSIGIAMVNLDDGRDPYPEAQAKAVQELVATLVAADPNIKWLTTHRQISWPRKVDPLGFAPRGLQIAAATRLIYWQRSGVPEA